MVIRETFVIILQMLAQDGVVNMEQCCIVGKVYSKRKEMPLQSRIDGESASGRAHACQKLTIMDFLQR